MSRAWPTDSYPTHQINPNPKPVPVSTLPGVTERPTPAGLERHYSYQLYGESSVDLEKVDGRVRLEHVVDTIPWRPEYLMPPARGWLQIARQRLIVWATVDGAFVGGLELRHGNSPDDLRYLDHPTVWRAFDVKVVQGWENRHIGRSLYAHVRAFGYELGKDAGTPDGDRLWDRMDPGWRMPTTVLFSDFTDDQLVAIAKRFEPGLESMILCESHGRRISGHEYGLMLGHRYGKR